MSHPRVITALVLSAIFTTGCPADPGTCDIEAATSPIYYDEGGFPAYPGQALVDVSCGAARFCHAQGIAPEDRGGAPLGLDLDVGVAVSPDDVERLRHARRVAWNLRHIMLAEVESGTMPPPPPAGDEAFAAGATYRAHRFTPEQRDLPTVQSPEGTEMLRNWLACGAHVIEATEGVSQGVGDIVARGVDASCPDGQALCGDACIDISADPANCGGCGVSCGSVQACVGGACACLNGLDACGVDCVDLGTDVSHCGGCSSSCGDRFCASSMCVDSCPGSTTDCGGSCVDLQANQANCGGCGSPCGTGESCESGVCSCASGFDLCAGVCADLSSDSSNCGACGNACDGGTQCRSGTCACADSATLCGGSCADIMTDVANCGGCGVACADGEGCAAGACVGCGPAVSFTEVEAIFERAGCGESRCHGGARPAASLNLTPGRAYNELVGQASSCGGTLVSPGDVESSYLWNKLTGVGMCSGNQMPKVGAELPQAELDAIQSWICRGAAND